MIPVNDQWRVVFEYERDPAGHPHSTQCSILDNEDNEIGYGAAWCHPKDQFNKDVGRKMALSQALKAAAFDLETRKMFWDSYLHRK